MLALRTALLLTGFLAGFALAEVEAPAPAPEEEEPPVCCKICRKGKACGDTCVARDKECTVPKGCACDSDED
ncbi:MAG: hypothetical protein KC457_32515 [Myxococcales bacterium]|nr:hypothetical protein [Myxococcales bacterium]